MNYERLSDMPPGLRRLVEKQIAKEKAAAQTTTPKPTSALAEALSGEKKPKRKYNNRPTERLLPNGECIQFKSKKEAVYYDGLIFQQKQGRVRKIRIEVEYQLKRAYTDGDTGERFRGISYKADFVFERLGEDGQWREHIVDTKGGGRKGTETKTFIIKRKLMAEQGYHVEVVE